MNIQTVAQNLRNTIAGKEQWYDECDPKRKDVTSKKKATVIREVLKINIDELRRILQDVEQCIPKEPEFADTDSDEVRNLIRQGR